MPWISVQIWWWYKPVKVTISLSLSLCRKRVVASHQPDRGVTRSWTQPVPYHLCSCSTYHTRHPWTCQGRISLPPPWTAVAGWGATCSPKLLPWISNFLFRSFPRLALAGISPAKWGNEEKWGGLLATKQTAPYFLQTPACTLKLKW